MFISIDGRRCLCAKATISGRFEKVTGFWPRSMNACARELIMDEKIVGDIRPLLSPRRFLLYGTGPPPSYTRIGEVGHTESIYQSLPDAR